MNKEEAKIKKSVKFIIYKKILIKYFSYKLTHQKFFLKYHYAFFFKLQRE